MVKQRQFSTYLGVRGVPNDVLWLSGYNALDINVLLTKQDAGNTGQLYAINELMKPFTFDQLISHVDLPNAAYLWLPPDGGTVAHETRTGATMTIGGSATGIVAGTAGALRYGGQFGMLYGASSASAPAGGLSFLTFSETSGQSWSCEFWITRQSATVATIYIEQNAGGTVYLQILLNASGTISIVQSGVVKYTSTYVLPIGQWTHIGLTYTASAAQIGLYANGVIQGALAGYTRAVYAGIATISWNTNANGAFFVALGALYNNVTMAADDYGRHHIDMTQDANFAGNFVTTPATLAQYTDYGVQFSNSVAAGYNSAAGLLSMPLTPLCGVLTGNGIYYAEVTIREYEGNA